MKPEKQNLIHDLLDGESRREATLLAGTAILRRRRQWRATRQVLGLIAFAGVATWLVEQTNERLAPVQIAAPAQSLPPLHIQSLTDDQLLALFPNTPVALATLPNGKKMLIFPRPGDEAKFMTRL
jgi:type VI protein secretion system component VasK